MDGLNQFPPKGVKRVLDSAHAFAFVVEHIELAAFFFGGKVDLVEWNTASMKEWSAGEVLRFAFLELDSFLEFGRFVLFESPPFGVVMEWAINAS